MTRFVSGYNVDTIAEFSVRHDDDGNVVTMIFFKDGGGVTLQGDWTGSIIGRDFVVQVIEPSESLYIVHRSDEDGKHCAYRIDYLGICADGDLKALELGDGYFTVREADYLCEGIYTFRQLEEIGAHFDTEGNLCW